MDASKAMEALDRSQHGPGKAGANAYKQARQQVQSRYGNLAQRVLGQQQNIFKAQTRSQQVDESQTADFIWKRTQELIQKGRDDAFGNTVSPAMALKQAVMEHGQLKTAREALKRALQNDGKVTPEEIDAITQDLSSVSQPSEEGFVGRGFEPQQISQIRSQLEQTYPDLPYTVGMRRGVRPDGSAGLTLTAPDGTVFEGMLHPGSLVPLAVVRSEEHQSLAEAMNIPHVLGGNLNDIKNMYKLTESASGASAKSNNQPGMAGFDEDALRDEYIRDIGNIENLDEIWQDVSGYLTDAEEFSNVQNAYKQLVDMFNNQQGTTGSPNPAIFAEWAKAQLMQGDEETRSLIESFGVTESTSTLDRPIHPEESLLGKDGESMLRAINVFENLKDRNIRALRDLFKEQWGVDLNSSEAQIALSKRNDKDSTPEQRELGNAAASLNWRMREYQPSEDVFKKEWLKEEISHQIENRRQEAMIQQQALDEMEPGRVGQEAASRALRENYTHSFDNLGQDTLTLSSTPNKNFRPRPLQAFRMGTGDYVPVAQSPSDIPSVALDTPFIITLDGRRQEVRLSSEELREAMGNIGTRYGPSVAKGSPEYNEAVVNVMKVLTRSAPHGFYKTISEGRSAAEQMVRRLGWESKSDVLGYPAR